MNIIQILKNEVTCLPIEQAENSSFRSTLHYLLQSFEKKIESSSDSLDDSINDFPEAIKNNILILSDGILKTVDAYYEGNIQKAYGIFDGTLKKVNVRDCLGSDQTLEANTNLYRIRVQPGNYSLDRLQLFHIPFEKRGIVRSQRYSIHGLPSLYLSNSLFVAWEEMLRPSFNSIQSMRLTNNRLLKILDLTTDIYNLPGEDINSFIDQQPDLQYKIMIWPLIASCSIKVKNKEDSFKPEYIIPQLLLQWVNKNEVDAIKYSSTHIDLRKNHHRGYFYNLVVPVKVAEMDAGYCPELLKIFNCTEVIPMQLGQFLGSRFYGQGSISTNVNPDIQAIELIKGNIQPYSETQFGLIEHALKYLIPRDLEGDAVSQFLVGNRRILVNIELNKKSEFLEMFNSMPRYSRLKTTFNHNRKEIDYFTFQVNNGNDEFIRDFENFLIQNNIGYKSLR